MRNAFACVSDPNSFFTCSGDPIHILYSARVEPNGEIVLAAAGKENIQEMIDSFREQTDFSWILSRLAAGDTSVLNAKEPMFGDFTAVPKSYAEALQMVMDAESKFYELPKDIRNLFDNDYRKWFASAGSEDWISKMNSFSSEKDAENVLITDDNEVKTE